jgi:hypothetical protein
MHMTNRLDHSTLRFVGCSEADALLRQPAAAAPIDHVRLAALEVVFRATQLRRGPADSDFVEQAVAEALADRGVLTGHVEACGLVFAALRLRYGTQAPAWYAQLAGGR